MGTRSEISIRDHWTDEQGRNHYSVIELWKHWDGYPEGIEETLKSFVAFINKSCDSQRHMLFSAEDFAAMLIASSYNDSKVMQEKYVKDYPDRGMDIYPDIRPRGFIDDSEYTYLIDLDGINTNKLVVKVYDCQGSQRIRDSFKNGTERDPDSTFEVEVSLP